MTKFHVPNDFPGSAPELMMQQNVLTVSDVVAMLRGAEWTETPDGSDEWPCATRVATMNEWMLAAGSTEDDDGSVTLLNMNTNDVFIYSADHDMVLLDSGVSA